MKKPRKIDNFLHRHFEQTNHSPSGISIQPAEKIFMIVIPLKDNIIIKIFLGMK